MADFAARFQAKYAALAEAWRLFAAGDVPEAFPPGWRGVNYYASVFSNDADPRIQAAAQSFLGALDAAKFDGRTYIANLTLATQAFAQAVCRGAGLAWEASPPAPARPTGALPRVAQARPVSSQPAPAPAERQPAGKAVRKPAKPAKLPVAKPAARKSAKPARKPAAKPPKPAARKPAKATRKPAAKPPKPAARKPAKLPRKPAAKPAKLPAVQKRKR